ncbi:LAG1 homologue 2 [Tasmannia lanceolata]|uniref:LAG1 homologue 2 n=1 Tax=Tasmannia lanceolata TaxID=3420 RepID=UPI004063A26F
MLFLSLSRLISHMDSIWSSNEVPHPRDALIAILLAFGFVATRFFLDFFFYQRLAIRLLSNGTVPAKISEAKQAKIVKCSESMWKLTYYATVQSCILAITYHEPWFSDINEYFKGWPTQELKVSLKLYYMSQCGFYIYSIVALLTWETRRKDFSIMMSHHIVTVILIWYSYITSFFRIGSIILALHDASDVFMEAAKIFKYSEKELGASICFGFFAVSWLLLRLIFFPFWVIRATSYNLIKCLNLSESYPTSLYYIFNTMLLTLLVFHVYWWILICSMVLRQLRNGGQVGEDIRSDSEDED